MWIFYEKPVVKSYSTGDILEELGPCQNQYETTATLNPSVDDWIYHADGVHGLGSEAQPSYPIAVGDSEENYYFRGFFGFDISSIQSTIVSATLRLYQTDSDGAPYTDLANLYLDHVNFGTLETNATDFDGNDITRGLASTSDSDNSEWKEFDVKSAVQADIDAGRTTSQFRVRFATNTDGNNDSDYILIEDTENHGITGNKAQLVVTYQ